MTERSEDPREALDPVDEMKVVLTETLRANDLTLWSASGAHVFNSETALDGMARGLLARRVAEPSRALAQAAPPRSDDLETVCHAILGGTSYLPHREAAQRLLAQAAPPPETETMTLQRGPNWTDSHSGTTHKTWLPAQAAPPSGLDVDDETLAVALHEANVAGVDDYPSWVAYARDILRVLAALRSPR